MRGKVVAAVLMPLAVLAGGYAWADAQDIAPGILTSAPLPSPQPPLITASPLVPASPSPGPVTALAADAPLPSSSDVAALAAALRADPRTGKSTNVYVADYTTGALIASLDGEDPQVPASTTKLLTAVAALEQLGPDFTFDTTVRWSEASSTLTLVAGGDLMLAAGHGHGGTDLNAEGEPQANGWTGIADLGDQIAASVPAREVTLAVDTSDFPGPAYPAAWPSYALAMGYAGTVQGIAINIGKKDGIPASEYGTRDSDTAKRALKALAADLTKRGYTVRMGGKASAASGSEEVARVHSAPLSAVVSEFLRYSDNTVAEQTARVLALHAGKAATPANAAEVTRATLVGLGVDVTGLVLHDGAGYSASNRVAPATLVGALIAARDAPNTAGLLTYLPLGGLEGTVAERFEGAPAAGFLRAKTGSLTGVTALTGVVLTADGRQVAFAALLDGMPYGQDKPMAAVNDFVNALAECGCDG